MVESASSEGGKGGQPFGTFKPCRIVCTDFRRALEACHGGRLPNFLEGVRAFSNALRLGLKCMGFVAVTSMQSPHTKLEIACAGPLHARVNTG